MTNDGGQAAGRPFDPTTTAIMPSEVVTRLVLLRHGEVEDFGKRVVRGQLDAPLSPEGVHQHARLVDWLAANEERPDQLYTSDLVRCGELAQRLDELWDLRPTITKLLREQSLGRWQGRTWDEITAEDGALVTAYWDDYANTRPPEGESLVQVSERARTWLTSTLQKHPGETIFASTHIGVIRTLLCHLLHVSPTEALRFSPGVASTTEVLLSDAGAVITRLGERPWTWGREP